MREKSDMLQFESPQAFLFLIAIPLLFVFRKTGIFSKFYFYLPLSDWEGKPFSYKSRSRTFFSFIANFFALAAYILLVTALANPIIRQQEKIYISHGTDIFFVLDTSPSMAARDISLLNVQITRMEAAKLGIKNLVSDEKGASYGLVALASEAACIVPPTNDIDLFLKRLQELEIGDFGEGSAIGIGLSTAIYHLSSSLAPKKCIVLITDGENNAGQIHPETAATLAKDNGISLYTFGIGTKGSVPIEYVNKKTGKSHSGFYESDFASEPLEKIARMADGEYFGIESGAALSEALAKIIKKEDSNQTFQYRANDTDYYADFLIFALIFFAAAWFTKRIILSEIL